MKMKWINLLIYCFLLPAAQCGSHSLVFMSTGRVQPQPSFEQLTVFDGVAVSHCDSLTRTQELKPSLESKNLPEHCEEAKYNVLESLREFPLLTNTTVYFVQRRRGCIQSASGTVSAFEAWSVNGLDFLTFDPESQRWISRSPSATMVQQHWNNKREMNSAFRWSITVQCPRMMEKILLKPINPKTELRVFAKPTGMAAQVLLRCHVTSTDRSISSVHLTGDGASRASWITVTGPVPAEDGSVILRLTAQISLSQNTYTYGCTIQTGGHNITVIWDGNTLDGRYLLALSTVHWKELTIILGICCVGATIIIISCATILLLKCVKMKTRPPPRVDPEMLEQFAKFVNTVPFPVLQNVIAAFIKGTERDEESQEQWEMRTRSKNENYYDPDYFAHQLDGANE